MMKSDELQNHMFATYANLRIGVAAISIVFPLLLWAGGVWLEIPFQESMSAYYHATEDGKSMRNWFVGILFAVGIILYLYKGYSSRENYALNLAGVFAVGIAIFPMEWDCEEECKKVSMHGICAVLFFLSIAYVCIRCASNTLHLMKNDIRERWFRVRYQMIGIILILSPLIAALLMFVLDQYKSYTFIAEAVGIWIFSIYWLLKSWEISITNSEHLALQKALET